MNEPKRNDLPTVVALAALAYLIAVALHEHLGHAAACVALGSRPSELGAFYVSCDDSRLSPLGVRLVAIAGPLVSLMVGLAAFALLPRAPQRSDRWLFGWLLGTLGLMNATGYLFFSGVAGIGDLGVGEDGALANLLHADILRIAFAILGGGLYFVCVRYAVKRIEIVLPGTGNARVALGRCISIVAYITGALLYLAIGVLNPRGLVIVLVSSMASSLGGTSGFLWMMETMNRQAPENPTTLAVSRRPMWIAATVVLCVLYAATFGPTIRP